MLLSITELSICQTSAPAPGRNRSKRKFPRVLATSRFSTRKYCPGSAELFEYTMSASG
jgi:hypothetical protein